MGILQTLDGSGAQKTEEFGMNVCMSVVLYAEDAGRRRNGRKAV